MKNNDDQKILLEVGVKIFLYSELGKFLFLKRSAPYSGQKICKWDLPGGRIKPGEKTEKALKREVREETGLALEKIEKVLAVQDILRVKEKHIVRITFLGKCKLGKIKLDSREHSEYKWLNLNELKKYKVDLYLSPVIKQLLDE
ncbi:MAG: NUDIX hydrolase [Candidatus Daviesbacteria bacterium]|nr:NUDIX hydrolase [Candidatus Daviesbacteria bacterium]